MLFQCYVCFCNLEYSAITIIQLQQPIKRLSIAIVHTKVVNCAVHDKLSIAKPVYNCSREYKSSQLQYCIQKLSIGIVHTSQPLLVLPITSAKFSIMQHCSSFNYSLCLKHSLQKRLKHPRLGSDLFLQNWNFLIQKNVNALLQMIFFLKSGFIQQLKLGYVWQNMKRQKHLIMIKQEKTLTFV